MVIDQIVAELCCIQKEPKITNFASSTTLIKQLAGKKPAPMAKNYGEDSWLLRVS